jgi:hypothetical protein
MISRLFVCMYVLTEWHYIRVSLFALRLMRIFAANRNRTFSFYENIFALDSCYLLALSTGGTILM